MALRVTTQLPEAIVDQSLDEIIAESAATNHLTPRSKSKLRRLLDEGRLALVFDENTLIGWAVREPLTKKLSEIGMAYIKPEYRGSSAFKLLTQELAKSPENLLFATYNDFLIRYCQREFGFVEVDLKTVLHESNYRFLLKRLRPKILLGIREKFQTNAAHYAIWYKS